MITRQLGDLQVGAIGLGCMGMAMVYGRPDPTEARATIDQALDGGVTLLDTADMYGNGASERFVGNAIRGRRRPAGHLRGRRLAVHGSLSAVHV